MPLSYAQRRLWFLDRLQGASTEYNIPGALRLSGELDRQALEKSINTIIERHESLRTRFAEVDGQPAQVIEAELRIGLPLEDLSGLPEVEQQARMLAVFAREGATSFDLARGPLLSVTLLKLGERDHILLRTMHHIVSDGWSEEVFNRELILLYEAFREGRENPLSPLTAQYADFALWQRTWQEEEWLGEELAYWKEQLAGIPELLELPTDGPRPMIPTFRAEVCQLRLSAEQAAGLKRLSHRHEATLYMTMLAAFGVLLTRYSGQDDIVVGSPIANRQEAELEELIGFFVNSLVVRMRTRPELRFAELLKEVRRTVLEMYEHQDLPFERLVEEFSPRRSLNTAPVFQVAFALHNVRWVSTRVKGLEVERMEFVEKVELRARYDLEAHVWENKGEIGIYWIYSRDLFARWKMEQMVRHYLRVLEEVAIDPERRIRDIDLFTVEERRQILEEKNRTAREIPKATLPELIEEQVRRTPEAIALEYKDRRLTYQELNERANRLAHLLISQRIGPEDVVALAAPRSPEMIVSLLGILKAGAAYLPIDADYPAERVAFMLADAEPVCLLTTTEAADSLPDNSRRLILDHPETVRALAQCATRNPTDQDRRNALRPENSAYVIYTSGSSGRPKGVVVSYSGIAAIFKSQEERLAVNARSRILQFSSLSFDASAWEVLMALGRGGSLVLLEEEDRSGRALQEAINENQVTHATLLPSVLATLETSAGLHLETLVVGGEASAAPW